jgi:hypothetical protein
MEAVKRRLVGLRRVTAIKWDFRKLTGGKFDRRQVSGIAV